MLTFNRLPEPARHVAFEVIVQGASVQDVRVPVAHAKHPLGSLASKPLLALALEALSDLQAGRIPRPSPDEFDLSSANDED